MISSTKKIKYQCRSKLLSSNLSKRNKKQESYSSIILKKNIHMNKKLFLKISRKFIPLITGRERGNKDDYVCVFI